MRLNIHFCSLPLSQNIQQCFYLNIKNIWRFLQPKNVTEALICPVNSLIPVTFYSYITRLIKFISAYSNVLIYREFTNVLSAIFLVYENHNWNISDSLQMLKYFLHRLTKPIPIWILIAVVTLSEDYESHNGQMYVM